MAFARVDVASFEGFQAKVTEIIGDRRAFAFRGYYATREEDPDRPQALVTGLERVCLAIDGHLEQAHLREVSLIREFMRRAHHYLSGVPKNENLIEWLALMQHHGAPTRLLDWTYSLYTAAHFALWHASRQSDADPAIWMIGTEWCLQASAETCRSQGRPALALSHRPTRYDQEEAASHELLADVPLPLSVWPVNPFRLNERLTLQKGVFLASGNVADSFTSNLNALPGSGQATNVVRFVLPRDEISRLGKHLYDANVTETTLFPGLDGFGKSLWLSARYLNLEHLQGITSL